MSLVYPDGETDMEGKTSEKTDRFRGKIAQFISNSLVVWKTVLNSDDSAFAGEMTIRTPYAADRGRHRGYHDDR